MDFRYDGDVDLMMPEENKREHRNGEDKRITETAWNDLELIRSAVMRR